jgi:ParB family chromosome partitioning protein
MTHQQIADVVGKSRATVTNMLRISDVSDEVKSFLREGKLDMGHARALLTLHARDQKALAQRIVSDDLSVRATEAMARKMAEAALPDENPQGRTAKVKRDADTLRLEHRLSLYLGAEVQLQAGKQGSGRIVIQYAGLDELQGILERMGEPGDVV